MCDKYYDLLIKEFNQPEKIITEIINLEAILNLPKGTEHFVSDLHGEYESFSHVLRNGSGNVRQKIDDVFSSELSPEERKNLATLIYYPEEKLLLQKEEKPADFDWEGWYRIYLDYLVRLTRRASTKYTRSKVRKAMPPQFSYIMEELLYKVEGLDKEAYYLSILKTMIRLGQAERLIIAFCYLIQRLVVDHLHVVGDIYDRGPLPDRILDTLIDYHSLDIQWGNHDILWLGSFAGSQVCLCNVLRICARYGNLDIIEDTYGINLRPLSALASQYYEDNPAFRPILPPGRKKPSAEEYLQMTRIHQAAAILQFKLELAIIERRPEFQMEHRRLLEMVDYASGTVVIGETVYPLSGPCFSTVDPKSPKSLLPEEQEVIDRLLLSFQNSEKMRRHCDFLVRKGSLYLCYNDNLLFHGCVPMHPNGDFQSMKIAGKHFSGKALLDEFEHWFRYSYSHPEKTDDLATDLIWYLWTGECSSLFGKKDMTTFERYFIQNPETHIEQKNAYYSLREQEETCDRLLEEFGLDPKKGHIINGHTPVSEINGESPLKANRKLIVIDGGFSKSYRKKTGIAGYTLLYNSFGMQLAAHQPFTSKQDAIHNGTDILSTRRVVEQETRRKKVRDTNIGRELAKQSAHLQKLFHDWKSKEERESN